MPLPSFFVFEKGLRPYVILSILCLIFYLPGLASVPPLDRDESRFAQATAQMLETGDFVQIRFQDEMRAKKPVGAYWVQAASVSILSDAEAREIWAYRLPSTLAAWASVLLVFGYGRRLLGVRPALCGAALLSASLMLVLEAHQAKTDALLLLCTVLSLGALGRIYMQRHGGDRCGTFNAMAFWGGLGAGILVKGPVVPMVAGLTVLSLVIADRSARWLRGGFYPLPGIVLTAAITVPWFLAIQSATGGAFIGTAIKSDLLPKLIGGHESHGAWPGYYLVLVSVMFWPASLFLWPAVVRGWFLRRHAALRFCLAWLIPSWIVFELVPTKLPHYVLPLYPALALLAGAALAAGDGWLRTRIAGIWYGIWMLIGLVLAGGVVWASTVYGTGISLLTVLTAGIALASGILPVVLIWKGRMREAFAVLVTCGGLTLATVMGGVLPELERLGLSSRLAGEIRNHGNEAPIVVAGYSEPSVVFLLGTQTYLTGGGKAARYLADHPGSLAVIAHTEDDSFKKELHNLGKEAISLTMLAGFNYSRGKPLTLTLYRLGE